MTRTRTIRGIIPEMPRHKQTSQNGEMSLAGHLKELRNRIILCVLFFVAAFVACLAYAQQLVTLLTRIGERYQYQFVYLSPEELLLVYFSIALIGAAVVSTPMIGYHLYAFCSPGLKRRERMFFLLAMVFGALCFCLGVLFAYWISIPFMLQFFISLGEGMEIAAAISVQSYISFLLTVFVIFGVVFELPVISVLLTQLGILKPEWLAKSRKVMIVVIFFVAAVITPPDVISQIMVAVPMLVLYELSVLLSRMCAAFKAKRRKEPVQSE